MDENILVIGSGVSFHNLRAFSWGGSDAPDPANEVFQVWLIEVCAGLAGKPARLIFDDQILGKRGVAFLW